MTGRVRGCKGSKMGRCSPFVTTAMHWISQWSEHLRNLSLRNNETTTCAHGQTTHVSGLPEGCIAYSGKWKIAAAISCFGYIPVREGHQGLHHREEL